MCDRSAIYCWSNVYTFGPYFLQRCVNVIFTIWRGVSNPTCRDWVYTTTSQTEVAAECLPVFLSRPQMHSTLLKNNHWWTFNNA